jgi:hypothetical protein
LSARSIWKLLLLAITAPGLVLAGPCVAGNLNSYFGLGPQGCDLGSVRFSNFSLLSGSGFSTALDPAAIQVTPFTNLNTSGFLFALNTTAASGQVFETNFSFTASALAGILGSGTVGIGGSTVTPDGVNTGLAIFTPGGNAIAFDNGLTASLSESANLGLLFSTVTELSFTIDAGLSGSSTLNQGSISFTTVPEPSSLSTMSVLALALGGIGLRQVRRNRSKTN